MVIEREFSDSRSRISRMTPDDDNRADDRLLTSDQFKSALVLL